MDALLQLSLLKRDRDRRFIEDRIIRRRIAALLVVVALRVVVTLHAVVTLLGVAT